MWDMQIDLVNTESNLGNTLYYQYYEETNIMGYPIKYVQAVETENNPIFGESTARDFLSSNGFDMKSKRDDDTMYQGGEVYGGFGYTPSYSQILYIPKKYFDDLNIEPLEDDLIYDKIDNIFFQISKVNTKTEEQGNIKVNNLILAYKIYLKQYTWGYKDTFDASLTDELIDDELTLEDLENINLDLETNIDSMNILDNTKKDNIFGDLG